MVTIIITVRVELVKKKKNSPKWTKGGHGVHIKCNLRANS